MRLVTNILFTRVFFILPLKLKCVPASFFGEGLFCGCVFHRVLWLFLYFMQSIMDWGCSSFFRHFVFTFCFAEWPRASGVLTSIANNLSMFCRR